MIFISRKRFEKEIERRVGKARKHEYMERRIRDLDKGIMDLQEKIEELAEWVDELEDMIIAKGTIKGYYLDKDGITCVGNGDTVNTPEE